MSSIRVSCIRLSSLTLLAMSAGMANTSFAQSPSPLAPEASQFDFWLGSWTTEMSSVPDFSVKRTGTDEVRSLLDGRLIEEVFKKDSDGQNFQRGYLTYLARDNQWQHIIYDAKWGEYRFVGGKVGENYVLQTTPEDTRPLKHRETFSNITDDSFTYTWESSQDNGETWQRVWIVEYQRAQDDDSDSAPNDD